MHYDPDTRTLRFRLFTGSPRDVAPVSYGEYRAIVDSTARDRQRARALAATAVIGLLAVSTLVVFFVPGSKADQMPMFITFCVISLIAAVGTIISGHFLAGSRERDEAERVLRRDGLFNSRRAIALGNGAPGCGACQNKTRRDGTNWVCDDCGLTYGPTGSATFTDPTAEECRAPCENTIHANNPSDYYCGDCVLPAGHRSPFHCTDCIHRND